MDMTNFGKVDYKSIETPQGYVCSKCGATDCKLWRDYQTFLENQHLLCAPCAAKEQEKDISTMDNEGRYETEHGSKTNSIGWLVPAVPTPESDSFWGYCSIPAEGLKWWENLPTFPVKKT
jgi:hypothetical protein